MLNTKILPKLDTNLTDALKELPDFSGKLIKTCLVLIFQ